MPQHIAINTQVLQAALQAADGGLWVEFPGLPQWLTGDKQPTVGQLAKLAHKTNTPFGYFFLPQLPKQQNTIPLFRTGSKTPVFTYSIPLQQTIGQVLARQAWAAEYLLAEGYAPLPFVGSASTTASPQAIAAAIRQVLQLPTNWATQVDGQEAALQYLINKIETVGIYLVINGIVGNNTHQTLDPNEFQGFALSHTHAPFIFINGKDYKAAQLFTLMHELAHIWLGASAISQTNTLLPPSNHQEKLCDAIAAELLVASEALVSAWPPVAGRQDAIILLSRQFKVSPLVIARRLLDVGVFTKAQYFAFYNAEKERWQAAEAKAGGGGDFYNNQPYRVGRSFFTLVDGAARAGRLLYSDAYKLTNLYGDTYHQFSQKMG